MKKLSIKYLTLLLGCLAIISSCKKDKNTTEITPPPTTTTASRSDLTKDSIFLYAKQVYLWNDALPTYEAFNPRQYIASTNQLTNFESELFAISQLKKDPVTGIAYEYIANSRGVQIMEPKFSYIEDLVASGKLTYNNNSKSAVGLDGEGNDFGFSIALEGTFSNYKIYVQYASPNSPSALVNVKRGATIEIINGRNFGTNFTSADEDFINSAINQNTISIAGKRNNGTAFSVTLNKNKYTSSPIYKDTIITVGAKKIGYLAYARFSNTANSEAVLNDIFGKFAVANVSDVVLDLRYNGGGFVSTAIQLINLIAPSRLNNQVMFSETYNSLMQSGQATILNNQPARDQKGNLQFFNGRVVTYADDNYSVASNTFKFAKKGSFDNVNKVVVITTDRTASASELVINSLKPYVDVKIVGEQSYGKPVGFFPIRIDKYDLYLSMFTTTNSTGFGNYYAGFKPDVLRSDDFTRDFGDPNELCFSAAISYINSGVLPSSSSGNQVSNLKGSSFLSGNRISKDIFVPYEFKGMIETREIQK